MTRKTLARTVMVAALSLGATGALAQTEIQWWHSMTGALNDRVNDLANGFNDSQKDYKVTPVYKGAYDVDGRRDRRVSAPATRRTSCRCSRSAPRR